MANESFRISKPDVSLLDMCRFAIKYGIYCNQSGSQSSAGCVSEAWKDARNAIWQYMNTRHWIKANVFAMPRNTLNLNIINRTINHNTIMLDNLRNYNIILASNSPRRKELLAGLGIDFEIRVQPGIKEQYPAGLDVKEIPMFLAALKAEANREQMKPNDLLITADTVVVCDGEAMGKPQNDDEARSMLRKLSGKTHHVITGVCIASKEKQRLFSVTTDVVFKNLTEEEIGHYVSKYRPYDKAGAYGIQEWIGYIGVTSINGSFFNVMGLPVQRLYSELTTF